MISEQDLYLKPQRTDPEEEKARQYANRMIQNGFIFQRNKDQNQTLVSILDELRQHVRVTEGYIENNERCLQEGVDSYGISLTDKNKLDFLMNNRKFRSSINVFQEAIEKVETFLGA